MNVNLTYPFVGDDLIGFLLQLVQTQSTDGSGVIQRLRLLIGRSWAAGGSSGGHVVQVQVLVLVACQVLLLQGFIQDVGMVPDLRSNRKSSW